MLALPAGRRGGKPAFLPCGMAILAVTLAAVPGGLVSPILIGLSLGGGLALVVTPLLSSTGDVLPPVYHGRGFGILSTCANVGIFSVPPLAGLIRDGTGSYLWPFMIMAALAAMGALVALGLRRGGYLPGLRRS